MEIFLIEEVNKHRNLWDIQNPHYKLRSMRTHTFGEIAGTIKIQWPTEAALLNGSK